MAKPPPAGIYVPVPTFFNPSSKTNGVDSLDLQSQCQHAIFLARSGITGIVLLGSTGEAVHIASNERAGLIKTVRTALSEAGFPSYAVLAGTATQSIEQTVAQLSESKAAGAGWGLVLAPGYFATNSVTQDGIEAWYKAVADRSPMPILVYHYPAVSNNVILQPSTMERLARHPNIVGCKLSHGNLSDHALIGLDPQIDHSKFYMFTGLGQQLLGVLDVGGAGAIDGLAACFPGVVVRLYDLFKAREQGNAASQGIQQELQILQYLICRGEALVVKWGSVGVRHILSRKLNIGNAEGARPPLIGGVPEKEWELYKDAIMALQNQEENLRLAAGG